MFGMFDITTSIPSPAPGPSADPGVRLGGTTTRYLDCGFGSGHIPSSTPFVGEFSLPSPGINTSVRSHGGGSGYVNVVSTPYIPSYVPSSTTLFPLNAIIMINPPYII